MAKSLKSFTKRKLVDKLKDEFKCEVDPEKMSKPSLMNLYKSEARKKRTADKKAEKEAIRMKKDKKKAEKKAKEVAPAPEVIEEAPVVKKPVAKETPVPAVVDQKTKLVLMLHKCGIEEVHTEMSVGELRKLYDMYLAKQKQKKMDKGSLASVNAMIDETENKVIVQRGKTGIVFPLDFRQARREDIGWMKVTKYTLTIVYNAGPKVSYDIRSCRIKR